jgi:lipoprotein-anchoring transpeptidase ErfK/SrfK
MLRLVLLAALQVDRPVTAADTLPDLTIVVDIAANRLELRKAGQVIARYSVATGLPAYPTPTGSFLIRSVELNPSWTPPASRWAAGRKPIPPGPANPMGRAKMMLVPQYYLHGTPDSLSLGSPASHGCIRLHNRDVLEVARLVIEAGAPALADSAAPLVADPVRSRTIHLERAIPIEVRYDPVQVAPEFPSP